MCGLILDDLRVPLWMYREVSYDYFLMSFVNKICATLRQSQPLIAWGSIQHEFIQKWLTRIGIGP